MKTKTLFDTLVRRERASENYFSVMLVTTPHGTKEQDQNNNVFGEKKNLKKFSFSFQKKRKKVFLICFVVIPFARISGKYQWSCITVLWVAVTMHVSKKNQQRSMVHKNKIKTKMFLKKKLEKILILIFDFFFLIFFSSICLVRCRLI